MTAIKENFSDLILPGLRKVFIEIAQEPEPMLESLFNVQPSSKPYEQDSSVGQFDDFDEFNGTIAFDDVTQGYDVKYEFTEYAKGFKIGRSLADDDLYGIISKKPEGLARAAKRTREKHGASLFNNAFTTETSTWLDGCELCASDHSSPVSGVSTQSNEGTTALSATAVESYRQLMKMYKGDRGEILDCDGDLILTPLGLEETAWEIINSKGKVDQSTNNANFHEGKYKLAVWRRLTDANNWFLIDSTLMKTYLLWFDRVKPEFAKDTDSNTLIAKFTAYMRYGYGWSAWQFIYGSLVS